ncbi:MAG: hypothetical protein IPM36_13325 [Lewinellaceae bacterium]|nr:hypothetical protein [Lewinellaceae bacterium]
MQRSIQSLKSLDCLGLPAVTNHHKILPVVLLFLFFALSHKGSAQQTVSFNIDGYTYQADINWVVKHNGADYPGRTAHSVNRSLDGTIDLMVLFKFRYDSIPDDQSLVWGFQFNHEGGLLSPARNEKRSRSVKLFQRFQLSAAGNAGLLISPKVWRKTKSNQFEVVTLAQPFKLNFTISENGEPAANLNPGKDSTDNNPQQPTNAIAAESTAVTDEERAAFNQAAKEVESTQKIKAFMSFVDKYSPEKPSSPLVAEAIKNVPLAASLPDKKGGKTFSYTLNYAVNPVIDTSSVKGWRWTLSESDFGRYQLILNDLGDTVHSFRIADLGKNAPFNRPREISPFDTIQVTLEGEDSDAFYLRFLGGNPPFIVFLSQDQVPKARYFVEQTDTLMAIPKSTCKLCKNGAHTLEVYDSDFNTLLLHADKAIHIRRLNYFHAGLIAVGIILVVYFLFNPVRRFWKRYLYEKQLREIEEWEKKDAM